MIDRETAISLSRELKIDLFTVFREYLQLLFLKYFYEQKGSEKVYFKGGTAIRFIYKSFRFSEDLDFTCLIEENRLKKLIEITIKALTKECRDVYFKKIETTKKSFCGKIFLKIKDVPVPLTVRLDLSLREKPVHIQNSIIETPFPVGPYPLVSHLKIEEILAEKIRALITRTKGRDIFDIWFILSKNINIDWKLVDKKMKVFPQKILKKFGWGKNVNKLFIIEKLINSIQNVPEIEIKNDLNKFLPVSHRSIVEKISQLTIEKLKFLSDNSSVVK